MGTDQPQGHWSGVETGWSVVSTLIGGIVTLGLLGFLADRALGTDNVLTGIGFVIGAALGIYIVYVRYGRGDSGSD
jgi:F0F1-type ATP synthase assembly protein I